MYCKRVGGKERAPTPTRLLPQNVANACLKLDAALDLAANEKAVPPNLVIPAYGDPR